MSTNLTKLILALLLLALCTTTQAQSNALQNPGFDTNLSGWNVFEGRIGVWSNMDANGSGSSGSALLTNQGTSTGNVPLVLFQCVAVQSGVEYEFGGDLRVLANQPPSTTAFIFVQGFSGDDCTGSNTQVEETASALVDAWDSVSQVVTAAQGTNSMRIGLGVFKTPGETADAQAYYDNIFLFAPNPAAVDPSKSASWYNPEQSGHGIMVHLLNADDAWMCWFTFDLDGNRTWICALGTIDGDTLRFEEAFTVDGGAFPPNFDPGLIEEVPWGSIDVVFTGCNTGILSWTTNAPGFQSGQMPIVRLTTLWGSNCTEE